MGVKIKRAFERTAADDGLRILVDGLWPRGLTREKLKIAEWMREIAPSKVLRDWYGHDPKKWPKFRLRYREELSKAPRDRLFESLVAEAREGPLTLVFSARDGAHSNAAVLAEMIQGKL